MQKPKEKANLKRLVFSLSPLFFLLLTFFIRTCYAEGEIDLTTIPKFLGEKLGIGEFAGGILASAILLLIFLLPIMIIVRGKKGYIAEMIFGLLILGVCVAIGWLHYFFFIILCMLVAFGFSEKMRKWLGGR